MTPAVPGGLGAVTTHAHQASALLKWGKKEPASCRRAAAALPDKSHFCWHLHPLCLQAGSLYLGAGTCPWAAQLGGQEQHTWERGWGILSQAAGLSAMP